MCGGGSEKVERRQGIRMLGGVGGARGFAGLCLLREERETEVAVVTVVKGCWVLEWC